MKLVTDPDGPTTVHKCDTYMAGVFGGDEDKQWQLEGVLAALEDAHTCSGICRGIDDDKALDLFVFANLNDGRPVTSCKGPLSELVEEHIGDFSMLYLVGAAMSGTMLGLLVLLLVCQIWLYCRKKCGRPDRLKKKKRAQNGMVVSGEDNDEPDRGGVEVADIGEPKARGGKQNEGAVDGASPDDDDSDQIEVAKNVKSDK